jgi:hypothetical protein
MVNYIEDVNRFKLAAPPEWWLTKLRDFDSSLVIVPSRQDAVYRLAQRRPLNLPENIVNDVLFDQSDTKLLASYSLVPVTTIIANPNWSNPFMFKELADRAPWRNGGADKVLTELDEHEMRIETQKRLDTEANLVDRAKDGWRLLKQKQGSTVLINKAKLDPRLQRLNP